MRNDSSNDLNHDLSKDFMQMSLYQNYKRTIKKLYLEACKMEKEKRDVMLDKNGIEVDKDEKKSKYVNDGSGGLLDCQSLFMALGSILYGNTGEDSSIVAVSFDTQEFGTLDYCVQMILCANGKTYKRIVSPYGSCSKFILFGGKQNG